MTNDTFRAEKKHTKKKLVRMTTVPESLGKLLEGQLKFMSSYYEVIGVSSNKEVLKKVGNREGVSVFSLELTRKITPIKDLIAVYQLYKFLKKESPFIIHTHTPKAGIVGMLSSYLAKVPNRIHTVAGLPLVEKRGFKRKVLNFVEVLTYFFATQVYPNSKGLQDFILKEKFTFKGKLKIIGNGSSNGIDLNFFKPDLITEEEKNKLKIELKIDDEDFVFIFVGRLVGDKGINELVKAFVKLSKKNKNVKLLLVGPFEEDLDPLSQETKTVINNEEEIISVGFQKDVRKYFAISDTLVFPSYREGFPNVVMQAGAMKIPSIVSDINGCNEIIAKGVNGDIIEVKSESAIFEKMCFYLENKGVVAEKGQRSRKIIKDNYDRKLIWETLLKEYKELE